VERLKAARTEAAAEIEALRAAKREHFSQYEQAIISGLDEAIAEQSRLTEAELSVTLRQAEAKRQDVVRLLLDKVLAVEPKLHPNVALHLGPTEPSV
jgi:V-type H+-transporting ATPase subunit G